MRGGVPARPVIAGPSPPCWSPSATAPASAPPPTSPPRRPPGPPGPRSTANTHPEAETSSSNTPCSAFAALHDPASRTYYDNCRSRGKTHTQALLRLARHHISVLFAMLRDGTFYESRVPESAVA
uniref:RacD protein n=1 Tax=Streptomyces ribosidificus TaxID=80859 RepID=Q4R0V6_STRRI|nr:RacD protein [Streptomyces ribosidificus]